MQKRKVKGVKKKYPNVHRSLEWFIERTDRTIWRFACVNDKLQREYKKVESNAHARALFNAQFDYGRFYNEGK